MDPLATEFRQQVTIQEIRACRDIVKLQNLSITLMQAYFAAHKMLADRMLKDLPDMKRR